MICAICGNPFNCYGKRCKDYDDKCTGIDKKPCSACNRCAE